jgi:type IV fimbrial biogenesis protein FimT
MFECTTTGDGAGRRDGGFTLIELMITIAAASILMAIAVPSFNQMIISGQLTAQSNEMVSALSLARSEAIKRNASVTLCRVALATDTTCATAAGNWQNWIVLAGGTGTVVRRGTVNTFNGTLVMRSTLAIDQVVFGPEGLARTGGAMVADHTVTVCSTRRGVDRNVRQVVLGAGSRMSTQTTSATCTA